jgi:hypothetical protein
MFQTEDDEILVNEVASLSQFRGITPLTRHSNLLGNRIVRSLDHGQPGW